MAQKIPKERERGKSVRSSFVCVAQFYLAQTKMLAGTWRRDFCCSGMLRVSWNLEPRDASERYMKSRTMSATRLLAELFGLWTCLSLTLRREVNRPAYPPTESNFLHPPRLVQLYVIARKSTAGQKGENGAPPPLDRRRAARSLPADDFVMSLALPSAKLFQ